MSVSNNLIIALALLHKGSENEKCISFCKNKDNYDNIDINSLIEKLNKDCIWVRNDSNYPINVTEPIDIEVVNSYINIAGKIDMKWNVRIYQYVFDTAEKHGYEPDFFWNFTSTFYENLIINLVRIKGRSEIIESDVLEAIDILTYFKSDTIELIDTNDSEFDSLPDYLYPNNLSEFGYILNHKNGSVLEYVSKTARYHVLKGLNSRLGYKQRIIYFNHDNPDYTHCLIKCDSGSRVLFNGIIQKKEDLQKIIELID